MSSSELTLFLKLKCQIQDVFLRSHTPSEDDISKWKGIDIVYFQEDLRKMTKSNISEKSFYTYFKNQNNAKLPRIDMLNLLSLYCGYETWLDFKNKNNGQIDSNFRFKKTSEEAQDVEEEIELIEEKTDNLPILQNKTTDNQLIVKNKAFQSFALFSSKKSLIDGIKQYLWIGISFLLIIGIIMILLVDKYFANTYQYCFVDSDRNSSIQIPLKIMVLKENESPIYYNIQPGECFYYSGTKDQKLKMIISSAFYEKLELSRNLNNAPENEKILLKPDDYKMAVYYFSKKDVKGTSTQILNQMRQKRNELENRISSNAIIYQVFESDVYGIETLDKQKYINLVTLPTTSLKNLSVIDMKSNKGKIILIKFKIKEDEAK